MFSAIGVKKKSLAAISLEALLWVFLGFSTNWDGVGMEKVGDFDYYSTYLLK